MALEGVLDNWLDKNLNPTSVTIFGPSLAIIYKPEALLETSNNQSILFFLEAESTTELAKQISQGSITKKSTKIP